MMNNIEISLGNVIQFDYPDASKLKRVLILGNTKNFFGKPWDEIEKQNENDINNVCFFRDLLENKVSTVIIGEQNGENEEFEYYENLIKELKNLGVDTQNFYKFFKFYATKDDNDYITILNELTRRKMKFDYIIQNPPYAGSLHLDIFDKTLDLLDPKGKMTIIEPATWLINVRKNGKAKKYDALKERLKGHIRKVVIENFDNDFFVNLYVPCSITYIDMDNTYDEIEFHCCGETKTVKNIYDCNLIGSYDMIWSILNKINAEKVDKHLYRPGKSEKKDGAWYCRFADIISGAGSQLCAIFDTARNPRKLSQNDFNKFFEDKTQIVFIKYNFGDFLQNYSTILYHRYKNDICNSPLHTYDKAKRLSDKEASCITGTKAELENWKHFVFNNKLPLFINIVMTIDQHNNSLQFVPWLVDRQYTDDEINKLFGFTDDEIAFMDRTIAKFERYSPWFKRYMCGPTSVSDEDVQKFVDNL